MDPADRASDQLSCVRHFVHADLRVIRNLLTPGVREGRRPGSISCTVCCTILGRRKSANDDVRM